MKIPLIAVSLLLLATAANAEMKVTVNVSINGPSITISGATEEDIESGKFWNLLSETSEQAKAIWRCAMGSGCVTKEEEDAARVAEELDRKARCIEAPTIWNC